MLAALPQLCVRFFGLLLRRGSGDELSRLNLCPFWDHGILNDAEMSSRMMHHRTT